MSAKTFFYGAWTFIGAVLVFASIVTAAFSLQTPMPPMHLFWVGMGMLFMNGLAFFLTEYVPPARKKDTCENCDRKLSEKK